uniref:Uncharacterized protein n=1 Tax=Rhizophora mucronata TaxID=61149 RepID=A0A2P2PXC9_RHIMU
MNSRSRVQRNNLFVKNKITLHSLDLPHILQSQDFGSGLFSFFMNNKTLLIMNPIPGINQFF